MDVSPSPPTSVHTLAPASTSRRAPAIWRRLWLPIASPAPKDNPANSAAEHFRRLAPMGIALLSLEFTWPRAIPRASSRNHQPFHQQCGRSESCAAALTEPRHAPNPADRATPGGAARSCAVGRERDRRASKALSPARAPSITAGHVRHNFGGRHSEKSRRTAKAPVNQSMRSRPNHRAVGASSCMTGRRIPSRRAICRPNNPPCW